MSMSDPMKQQILQEFFVLPEWENQHTYRKYLTYLESRQRGTLFESVAQCAVQSNGKNSSKLGDRGSNPVAINQFLTCFSLLGPHVLVLFFHLLIFFILRELLYLI